MREINVQRKIALTSSGPLSGKSTLARHLEQEYGFVRADHSRSIVESFVKDWNATEPLLSGPITVEEVYRDKETWRPLLQEWGFIAGFNDPRKAGRWVKYTLSEWLRTPDRDVVFDSLRGETQAQVLREMGFTLVQLSIPSNERCRRAMALDKNCEDIRHAMRMHPELEEGIDHPDIRLIALVPVDVLARMLLQQVEGRHDVLR